METSEPLLPTPSVRGNHNRKGASKKSGNGLATSISSQEASPASLQAKPDYEKEQATLDGSGQKCLESFESFSRVGSWAKTFAGYLVLGGGWSLRKSALTWKISATKFNRLLFQLSLSAHRTDEIASGSLPTPRVSEAEGAPVKNAEFKNGSWSRQNRKGVRYGVKVKDVIESMNLLPTPRAGKTSAENEATWRKRQMDGKVATPPLALAIRILPTPTLGGFNDTNDRALRKGQLHAVVAHGTKPGLKLQPAFALWMMDYPTDHLDLEAGEMPPSRGRATPSSRP